MQKTKPEKPYFFVVGLPRSGSTLLSYVLNSHSRIQVAHEDHARPFTEIKRERALYNLRWKIKQGFTVYLDSLLTVERKTHLVSTRYWKKKHVELIHEILGDQAKFIILTRRHMWRVFYRATGEAVLVPLRQILAFWFCCWWVKRNYLYFELTYHDMVSRPHETFRDLCRFMGFPFEERIVEYQDFDHSNLGGRGNLKTRKFGGIIDKSQEEKVTFSMLLTSLVYRFGRVYKRGCQLAKRWFYEDSHSV